MTRGRIAVVVLGLAAFGLPSSAAAHPFVAQARERYQQADFPGARDALDRAAGATDLTREDVIDLLEMRILVRFALGEVSSSHADLAALASIAPDHQLGPEASPELRAALAAAVAASPGPLALVLRVTPGDHAIQILGDVRRDPARVVRQVVVRARSRGGPWQSGAGRVSVRVGDARSVVEYHASAVGPGNAVLVARGTDEAPLEYLWAPTVIVQPSRVDWGLVAGVSGAALGAVLVAILIGVLAGGSDDAQSLTFSPPIVQGW